MATRKKAVKPSDAPINRVPTASPSGTQASRPAMSRTSTESGKETNKKNEARSAVERTADAGVGGGEDNAPIFRRGDPHASNLAPK